MPSSPHSSPKVYGNHRILISTDGPDHNVLKIKPPLVITEDDADLVVRTFESVLERAL